MQPQTEIQTPIFSNFTEEIGLSQPQARSDSDPRPFYLFSAGDHVHRVGAHDSVPHVWAGRAQIVKNHINWVKSVESMTEGIESREVIRSGKAIRETALPIWAGSIVNNVLRAHADLLVTTLETFEGRSEQEVNPVAFNCLIGGGDSFPYVIEPDWRVRDPRLNSLVPPITSDWKNTPRKWLDIANEKGGLAIRRAMAVSGMKTENALYRQAIEEVLAAYDRFASSMHLYLDEQERLIQSDKEQGTKAGYDPYDRYLLWLLGRKGIETARGVTREDMESLIGAVKQGGQPQTGITRDDILMLADALRTQPTPVTLTGEDSFETPKESAVDRRMRLAREEHEASKKKG